MPVPSARRQDRRRRDRARGQSLVEFALLAPVLLLIVLAGIDFGRVFVGWIGVNQMVRIAASYAATHPNDWPPPPPATNPAAYNNIFLTRESQSNCSLVTPIPAPVFDAPKEVGEDVRASVTCRFRILAPLISNIVGGQVSITSDASFPVQYGCLASCPPPPPDSTPPPPPNNCRSIPALDDLSVLGAEHAWEAAGFTGSVTAPSGSDSRTVKDFTVVPPADATSCTDSNTAFFSSSVTVTLEPQDPRSTPTCVWVPNLSGMTVAEANASWTSAGFTGTFTPAAGTVDDQIVIDQTMDPSGINIDDCAEPATAVSVAYEAPPGPPPAPPCKVPSFVNTSTDSAVPTWTGAGFIAGNLTFKGNTPFTVKSQNLVGGTYVGCSEKIELSKN